MGHFASIIAQGIDGIVNDIAKTVTDATTTVAQLADISQAFTPPAVHARLSAMAAATGGQNVNTALTGAMSSAKTACDQAFAKLYPNDTAAGTDNGVVQNYNPKGNVQTVINQMRTALSDWNLIADPTTISAMASTIQTEVQAQMGKTGVAHGIHYLNMNQYYNWVVAYGQFEIAEGNNGLVYAFSISFNSGW